MISKLFSLLFVLLAIKTNAQVDTLRITLTMDDKPRMIDKKMAIKLIACDSVYQLHESEIVISDSSSLPKTVTLSFRYSKYRFNFNGSSYFFKYYNPEIILTTKKLKGKTAGKKVRFIYSIRFVPKINKEHSGKLEYMGLPVFHTVDSVIYMH